MEENERLSRVAQEDIMTRQLLAWCACPFDLEADMPLIIDKFGNVLLKSEVIDSYKNGEKICQL